METTVVFADHISLAAASFAAWGLLVVLYGIFSLILVYHWRAYATNAAVISATLWWYFLSTGIFLLLAALLILFV